MYSTALEIETTQAVLDGDLVLPSPDPAGIVVFAHGSGSSRHSPRNRAVAEAFHKRGFGSLLFDLLTRAEEEAEYRGARFRFDVDALGERLVGVLDWLADDERTAERPAGLFGASTGAAAALIAAARRPDRVAAVVSRGGRPDLALEHLREVIAPTLLIVGGEDLPVIDYNRRAVAQLPNGSRMEIVPGATHLFEEPGAMEQVIELAEGWFDAYLR